jgi:hypothetical protein
MTETWRVGRKVGRTIYRQIGSDGADGDTLIGLMDSRELAATVVAAVNNHAVLLAALDPLVDRMRDAAVGTEARIFAEELAAVLALHREPPPTLCPDCDHGIAGGRPCATCGGSGYVVQRGPR